MTQSKLKNVLTLLVASWLMFSSCAHASSIGGAGYFVGRDNLAVLTSGAFAGLPNPNYGRLTFLLNHDNHYHSIGAYSYTGSPQLPVVVGTNANNRTPEISSLKPPLPLTQGSGSLYGDKLVNTISDLEYSDLHFLSTDSLSVAPAGSPEAILFNSSNGRWNQSLAGTQVQLELISITPGLYVGDQHNLNLFQASNRYNLGAGDAIDFTPVFWASTNVTAGKYSAEFRLIETGSDGLRNSGRFYIDFTPTPVPLPAGIWLFVSGLLAATGLTSKRKSISA